MNFSYDRFNKYRDRYSPRKYSGRTPEFVIISFPKHIFGKKQYYNFENPSKTIDDLKKEIMLFLRKVHNEDKKAIQRRETPPYGLKYLPQNIVDISYEKRLGIDYVYNVSFDDNTNSRKYQGDINWRRSPGRIRLPINL